MNIFINCSINLMIKEKNSLIEAFFSVNSISQIILFIYFTISPIFIVMT